MNLLKKYYKVLILLIVCILVYLIYNNSSQKNITYLTLGDGYSIGINSYGSRGYGYNDYLKDYLKSNNRLNKYYSNYSYNDMKIKDLYNDILINNEFENKENLKQVLRNSNLLTLSIGLNDLIYRNSLKENLSDIGSEAITTDIVMDLDILIDEIKKYYKGEIYLVGYYNFYDNNNLKYLLDELNSKYKEYAKSNNMVFIPIEDDLNIYFENPNSNYPSTLGYKQIYKEIVKRVNLEAKM